jgi:hypothetical protein
MSRAALYRHFDRRRRLLYVGMSLNTLNRLIAHRDVAHWFDHIAYVEIEQFDCRAQALNAERVAILNEKPAFNVRGVRHARPFLDEKVMLPSDAVRLAGGSRAQLRLIFEQRGFRLTRQAIYLWFKNGEIPPDRIAQLRLLRPRWFRNNGTGK